MRAGAVDWAAVVVVGAVTPDRAPAVGVVGESDWGAVGHFDTVMILLSGTIRRNDSIGPSVRSLLPFSSVTVSP